MGCCVLERQSFNRLYFVELVMAVRLDDILFLYIITHRMMPLWHDFPHYSVVCEDNPSVTSDFLSKSRSNALLWYLIGFKPGQAGEQTVGFLTIWETTKRIWCHRTPSLVELMGWWLCAAKQQAMTRNNVDTYLCRHMTSQRITHLKCKRNTLQIYDIGCAWLPDFECFSLIPVSWGHIPYMTV